MQSNYTRNSMAFLLLSKAKQALVSGEVFQDILSINILIILKENRGQGGAESNPFKEADSLPSINDVS